MSSKDQNLERQLDALIDFGLEKLCVFSEKASSKDFMRPQRQRLVRRLRKEDVLVIKSIDRLGSNYEETIEEWRLITKEKGVHVVILDMPPARHARGAGQHHGHLYHGPRGAAALLRGADRAR